MAITLVVSAFVAFALVGCNGRDRIHTETKGAVESTGTVQAGDSADSGADVGTAPSNGHPWPRKVGQFGEDYDGTVWYPAYIPAGFELETIDIVEFEPGTGLVCDVLFLSGQKTIAFTQGSPKARGYEASATASTPWGDASASLLPIDPSDPKSPSMVVLSKDGNLAELSGDIPLDELKKIAASMEVVK
jgi:hypothetical protein